MAKDEFIEIRINKTFWLAVSIAIALFVGSYFVEESWIAEYKAKQTPCPMCEVQPR